MNSDQFVEWLSRKWPPFYQALREVGVTAVITLTPVWVGVVLSILLKELPSFQNALRANTDRGDLFLLATAMMAPLALYISIRREGVPRPFTIYFPGGWFFILVFALLFGSSTILFAVLPTSALKVDQEFFSQLSFLLYILSVILALAVTAIKNALDALALEQSFREDTQNFVDAWDRRNR